MTSLSVQTARPERRGERGEESIASLHTPGETKGGLKKDVLEMHYSTGSMDYGNQSLGKGKREESPISPIASPERVMRSHSIRGEGREGG